MTTRRQLCTFRLGDLFLGVPVQEVQEVMSYRAMTRVPRARDGIRGLINLRGQIVPAVELRRCLGLGPRPADRPPMNVVVRTEDGAVSLLVDEIGDVLEVADEAFERPPETLAADLRRLIPGAFKLEGRLLLLLDTERVLHKVGEEAGAASAPAVPRN
jgi:purine-binding chemotaxis protein CheW